MKILKEQVIRYIDLILLGHSLFEYLNESYGAYISEFCFDKTAKKIKAIFTEEIIREKKLLDLPRYAEFEITSKKLIQEFEKRESLLKKKDSDCILKVTNQVKKLLNELQGGTCRFEFEKENLEMKKKKKIMFEKTPHISNKMKHRTPNEEEICKNNSSTFLLNSGRNFEDLNDFQKSILKSEIPSNYLDTFRNENFVTDSKNNKGSNIKNHNNWTMESKESLSTSLKNFMKQNCEKGGSVNFLTKFTSVKKLKK